MYSVLGENISPLLPFFKIGFWIATCLLGRFWWGYSEQ